MDQEEEEVEGKRRKEMNDSIGKEKEGEDERR